MTRPLTPSELRAVLHAPARVIERQAKKVAKRDRRVERMREKYGAS